MTLEALTALVHDLAARLDALEAGSAPAAPGGPAADGLSDPLLAGMAVDDGRDGRGTVLYAGAGPGPDGVVAWRATRRWDELTGADATAASVAFAALGNSHRVAIVQILLEGPASTGRIAARLHGPSSGQLFHHLKELLAAGLVHQPRRGTYAVRPQHRVPLLAALACALDLAGPAELSGG